MVKPPPRSRSNPSPVPAALERLATLSGAGTAAARMAREAERIIGEWQAEGLDASDLRERLEALRDDLAGGVAQAEEASGDVDSSDKGAVRQTRAMLDGLVAAHRAVMAALEG